MGSILAVLPQLSGEIHQAHDAFAHLLILWRDDRHVHGGKQPTYRCKRITSRNHTRIGLSCIRQEQFVPNESQVACPWCIGSNVDHAAIRGVVFQILA